MKTIVTLCSMFLLAVLGQNHNPCSCMQNYTFCANDYNTYHSICEYKCAKGDDETHDWYIMYDGPCTAEWENTVTDKFYPDKPIIGSKLKLT